MNLIKTKLVVIKDTLLDITTNDHPIDVNDDLFKKVNTFVDNIVLYNTQYERQW